MKEQGVAVAGLSIRAPCSADLPALFQVMFGVPHPETVGLFPPEAFRRFSEAQMRSAAPPERWRNTVLAEIGGEVVGSMQTSAQRGRAELRTRIKMLCLMPILAVRAFGPAGTLDALRGMRVMSRVQSPPPPHTYYIADLEVAPEHQNRGIGGALLAYAATDARQLGFSQMALHTSTSNPARRLYERHGYLVVETRTDAKFEQITGISGQHLMVKDL